MGPRGLLNPHESLSGGCALPDVQPARRKMLPPGGASEPTREERIDAWLENVICDIHTAVFRDSPMGV